LRTLINDVPPTYGPSVAGRLGPRLVDGVSKESVQEVKIECLDIISDLLKRFGRDMEAEHENLMMVVLQQVIHTPRDFNLHMG
jgi:hypothetical protein